MGKSRKKSTPKSLGKFSKGVAQSGQVSKALGILRSFLKSKDQSKPSKPKPKAKPKDKPKPSKPSPAENPNTTAKPKAKGRTRPKSAAKVAGQ